MVVFSGWQLTVFVSTGSSLTSITGSGQSSATLDGVQELSYDYIQNLDVKEATGQRTAYAIIEGLIGLSGTLDRFYTGSGAEGWARGASETGSLTSYYIGVFPNGTSAGNPYKILNSCKFGAARYRHRPNASLMSETLDFICTSETTGSI